MLEKRMRRDSAKQVAIDVLRAAREPLHAKEVAKRVIESGSLLRLEGHRSGRCGQSKANTGGRMTTTVAAHRAKTGR
jgi:hypothetical protein